MRSSMRYLVAMFVLCGVAASARAQDAPKLEPWPDPSKHDYRPAALPAGDAKLDSPPAWFVRTMLLGGEEERRPPTHTSVVRAWTAWSTEDRLAKLAEVHRAYGQTWGIERVVKKPAILPRLITDEMLKGEEPEWVREALGPVSYDASLWAANADPGQRRDYLEDAARRELLAKEGAWNKEHAAELKAEIAKLQKKREDAAAEAVAREQKEKQAAEEERKAAKAADAADHLKLAKACEAALKGPIAAAKLVDVLNDPKKFAGQVVKVDARVSEIIGRLDFADEWAHRTSCKLVLVPPLAAKPGVGVVIDFVDWQARAVEFENLKRARVQATIYVSKTPAAEMTDETPCVGRLLDVKAK